MYHCTKNVPLCDQLIIFSDYYGVNPTIGCFIGSSHLVSPLKVIFYPSGDLSRETLLGVKKERQEEKNGTLLT